MNRETSCYVKNDVSSRCHYIFNNFGLTLCWNSLMSIRMNPLSMLFPCKYPASANFSGDKVLKDAL